jgi:HEAT repeat protein
MRFAKAGLFLFLITAGVLYCADAQTPTIQSFYQALVDHYDPSSLPSFDYLQRVIGQIAGARPDEITKALPAIFAAVVHQDVIVSAYADSALYAIALRPDSAALLKTHIDALGHHLLASQNPDGQNAEIVILGTLQPKPPPEVVPIFLTFLKRTDGNANAQGSGVIFELVQFAPDDPEVISATKEFLSRPLDTNTRINVLNALGNRSVKDPHIVAVVIASLDDPDPAVRDTAIQVLTRMEPHALQQAEPALQRLANDKNQPANVVVDAKMALQRLHPDK